MKGNFSKLAFFPANIFNFTESKFDSPFFKSSIAIFLKPKSLSRIKNVIKRLVAQ
jgi:hypothetical protein